MVIALTIDETGRVRNANILSALNPVYDRLVTTAARSWRYTPATKNGVPVAYERAVTITIQ